MLYVYPKKMNEKTQNYLKIMIKDWKIPYTTIAYKVRKHPTTIYRWLIGERNPSYADGKLIEQIFYGYKRKLQEEEAPRRT